MDGYYGDTGMAADGQGGRTFGRTAARVGIAGAIALGAIASGLLVSRRGRRLLGEAWQGRSRTTIEDRVLESIWGDKVAGRRRVDVAEVSPGIVRITGTVYSDLERERVIELAEETRGVIDVEDDLAVVPQVKRTRRRAIGI